MGASCKPLLILAAGIALFVTSRLEAGEKVQFRGSTSIELPTPKRALDESRRLQLPDAPSGRSEFESGEAAAGVGMVAPTPQIDKKLKERLDKEKNWIFVNPYEMQFDSKTEEFMEAEKGTGLYEHRLMETEEKSVMEKFLEEKSPYREQEVDATGRPTEPQKNERSPNPDAPKESERPEVPMLNSAFTNQKEPDRGLTFSLDQKNPSLFEKTSIFDTKPERTLFTERTVLGGLDRTLSKEELRKERDARDAEITRMLQPRTGPSGLGRLDPVNTATDSTRQEANPFGGRRNDSFLSSGRTQPSIGGVFSGDGPIFGRAASPSSLPARSGFDFGPKASSPGASGFGGNAISAPAATPRPTVAQKPFVLPLPQRKF